MSKRAIRNLRFNRPPSASSIYPSPHRHVLLPSTSTATVTSGSRSLSTSLSLNDYMSALTYSSPESAPKDRLLLAKQRELTDSLRVKDPKPSRVWAYYLDLIDFMGHEQLPKEIHQAVLRKCIPPIADIRFAISKPNRTWYNSTAPHGYENRMQAVIRNIRLGGNAPDLEDYNFILEHFAVVGHYMGARQVLREMAFLGVEPRTRTFGLALQALAHRFNFPFAKDARSYLRDDVTRVCREVINTMGKNNIPFTSANMDLAFRILKETADVDGFQRLLKFGYGIDLSFPDSSPADVIGERADVLGDQSCQPLSTSSLNSIIDFLGSSGSISKMVTAFEVLLQPLPRENDPPRSIFDEDDEDDVFPPPGSSSQQPQPVDESWSSSSNVQSESEPVEPVEPPTPKGPQTPHPPHLRAYRPMATGAVRPNITTFNLIIRHASKAGHATFVRHYLLHAVYYDHSEDSQLRKKLRLLGGRPSETLEAPHMNINRGTLLPAFHEANHDKNVELMRFILKMTDRILRRKKAKLAFYSKWKADWERHQRIAERAREEAILSDSVLVDEDGANSAPVESYVQDTASTSPPTEESPADSVVSSSDQATQPSTFFTQASDPASDETLSSSISDSSPSLIKRLIFPPVPPPSGPPSATPTLSQDPSPPLQLPHDAPVASSSSSSPSPSPVSKSPPPEALDVDLDAPFYTPPPHKPFYMSEHIRILRRDLAELTDLEQVIVNALSKTLYRVKERLGRRVWGDRDVYFSEAQSRVKVERDEWRRVVRFKEPKKEEVRGRYTLRAPRGGNSSRVR